MTERPEKEGKLESCECRRNPSRVHRQISMAQGCLFTGLNGKVLYGEMQDNTIYILSG
jgi:hypothetical protein